MSLELFISISKKQKYILDSSSALQESSRPTAVCTGAETEEEMSLWQKGCVCVLCVCIVCVRIMLFAGSSQCRVHQRKACADLVPSQRTSHLVAGSMSTVDVTRMAREAG